MRPDGITQLNVLMEELDFIDGYLPVLLPSPAADVLNSLQTMQDYGVNLICVEDGIGSSKDSGKLVISVRSAFYLKRTVNSVPVRAKWSD